nr:MAG TPA: HORMA domain containing protein domain, CD-NTase, PROTEIN BINDING [Caudoviricetes sp.]
MEKLTKFDALIGELEPYNPSRLTLMKALADADVSDLDAEYTQADKISIAKAAIHVLRKFIVLSSDSLGKSSQGYQVDKLEKRIKAICNENGLDVSEFVDDLPSITDGSKLW